MRSKNFIITILYRWGYSKYFNDGVTENYSLSHTDITDQLYNFSALLSDPSLFFAQRQYQVNFLVVVESSEFYTMEMSLALVLFKVDNLVNVKKNKRKAH